jgi:hypothetical protein
VTLVKNYKTPKIRNPKSKHSVEKNALATQQEENMHIIENRPLVFPTILIIYFNNYLLLKFEGMKNNGL